MDRQTDMCEDVPEIFVTYDYLPKMYTIYSTGEVPMLRTGGGLLSGGKKGFEKFYENSHPL